MTTPDGNQPSSSIEAALQRVDELEARYGEACDRRDGAHNPIARIALAITAKIHKVDLRNTSQFAVEELEGQQVADGLMPMVED